MMKTIKAMMIRGLKMLTTKRVMLTAIVAVAGAFGMALNPEIASGLAEHLSGLLDMLMDAMGGGDTVGIPAEEAGNVG